MKTLIFLSLFCSVVKMVAAQNYFNFAFNANDINAEAYRGILYVPSSNSIIVDGTSIGSFPYLVRFDLIGNCLDTIIIENSQISAQFIPSYNNTLISDNNGFLVLNGGLNYNSSTTSAYILKLSQSGDTIWTREFGSVNNLDEFAGSIIAKDSNYIFTGATMTYSGSPSDQDCWLVKLDTSGNLIWENAYGGSNTDIALSVDTTLDDGFIIAGVTTSYGAGGSDIYVVRTDADGNQLWHKWFGATKGDGGYVKTLPSGNFLIYGNYSFVDPNNSSNYAYHAFAMELDQSGDQQWINFYDNYTPNTAGYYNYDEWFYAGVITIDGYVFCGVSKDSTDMNPIGWAVKTDFNGNELWSRRYRIRGNDHYFHDLIETADGGFILAGFVFPDGTGNTQDGWIVRTNCLGFDQPPTADAVAYNGDGNVIVLDNNSLYFGDCVIDWGDGNSSTVTEFDDSLVSHQYLTSGNYQIEIIANACQDSDTIYLNVNATPLGIENFEIENNFKMYPNPANSKVNIVFSFSENSTISVFDLAGKLVYFNQVSSLQNNFEIDLSGFETGTYIVTVQNNESIFTKKLIVF